MNKLSVKEKHIYVTQGLQRQGAYRKDKQYPQAIDLALTKAQNIIVKARLIPSNDNPDKFEINQKYVSDIQSLLKFDKTLITFKESAEKSYGVLPYDFSYLLSDSSYVVEDCKTAFTATTTAPATTERVKIIPFTDPTTAPYFRNIQVKVNVSTETITCAGFSTLEERVYLVDYIIDAFARLGVTVYWEDYKDYHQPKCFLLVTTELTLSASIITDGTTSTPIENKDTSAVIYAATITDSEVALNRDVRSDFLRSALGSTYMKPLPTSPLSILSDNKIIVFSSKRFLVTKVSLDYIRKPKRISLALNQGSELAASVHEEICDVAIRILKKQIEDPSYQIDLADTKERIINP